MGNFIKKLFVVLLLALVQTAVCNADSFKGKIVNAETGEILVGATIRSEINPHQDGRFRAAVRQTAPDASFSIRVRRAALCSRSA